MNNLYYLCKYLKILLTDKKLDCFIVCFIILVAGSLPVISLEILRRLLIIINNKEFEIKIFIFLLLILLINIIYHILYLNISIRIRYLNENIKIRLQKKIFQKIKNIDYIHFNNENLYNSLLRANKAIDNNLYNLSVYLPMLPSNIVMSTVLLVYLSFFSPIAPLILFLGIIPLMIIDAKFGRKKWSAIKKQTFIERKMLYLEELLLNKENLAELKIYNTSGVFLKEWKYLNNKIFLNDIKLAKKSFFNGIIGQIYIPLTMFILILFIILDSNQKVSSVVIFIDSVFKFSMSMYLVFTSFSKIYNDLFYIKDIFLFLERDFKKQILKNKKELKNIDAIEFINVSFKYPKSKKYALKNVSFKINKNENISIIGENGSGKSTLMYLILGIYEPTEGIIKINGIDMTQLNKINLWNKSSMIFQNFIKFHGTLKENIGFGDINNINNTDKIKNTLEFLNSDDLIRSFPAKLDTFIGKEIKTESVELSEGQWQKIAIARSYLRCSDLLILDEPTASLDAKVENKIYTEFKEISDNKITFFVSHRLASSSLSDRIFVFNKGVLKESGTHYELIKKKGIYFTMYNAQLNWY